MKKIILGTFPSLERASGLVHHLQQQLDVPKDDISLVYRTEEGEVKEILNEETSGESSSPYARSGAFLGSLAGLLIGVASLVVVFSKLVDPLTLTATGPFVTAFLMGAVIIGTLTVSTVLGVILGAVIGAVAHVWVTTSQSDPQEERVRAGNVLVVTHTQNDSVIGRAFTSHNALGVYVYTPTL